MDETHFKTLLELSRDGHLSQRDLSRRVGLSLGRVNFVVNSLIEKGYIKARRFKNSRNKMAYMYVLTPRGISEKVRVTRSFLVRKMAEYDALQREIEDLRREVERTARRSVKPGEEE